MSDYKTETGLFLLGDCLERMREIPDKSIDLILCDLPYGTTQNKWDAVIPFDALWAEYWRVAKPGAPVVLTAAQPFTSALVMSQPQHFRYDWTWRKNKATGHLNAKKMPMRDKEDVLVFCSTAAPYNPQMQKGSPYSPKAGSNDESGLTGSYGKFTSERNHNEGLRYPKQVLDFGVIQRDLIHPTQKPVELFEYLIRTYTDEGMTVLDNCAGSGTAAVAAERAGRNWVCIERDPGYFSKAVERIQKTIKLRME